MFYSSRGVARIARRAATGAQRAARLSTASSVLAKSVAASVPSTQRSATRPAGTSSAACMHLRVTFVKATH
jgi:hypothetical protein